MASRTSRTISGARPSQGSSSISACGLVSSRAGDGQHLLLAARQRQPPGSHPLLKRGNSARPAESSSARWVRHGRRSANSPPPSGSERPGGPQAQGDAEPAQLVRLRWVTSESSSRAGPAGVQPTHEGPQHRGLAARRCRPSADDLPGSTSSDDVLPARRLPVESVDRPRAKHPRPPGRPAHGRSRRTCSGGPATAPRPVFITTTWPETASRRRCCARPAHRPAPGSAFNHSHRVVDLPLADARQRFVEQQYAGVASAA